MKYLDFDVLIRNKSKLHYDLYDTFLVGLQVFVLNCVIFFTFSLISII